MDEERKLARYRSMRDAARTPEPMGDDATEGRAEGGRFTIQEHHATSMHWDLRLERDGVLASWAVPRGLPVSPDDDHLAVRTEDHPMEYLTFEGDIPEGNYGAGRMRVWDTGTYDVEKFSDREVMVTLHGSRVSGRYVLFHTRGKDWMVHRMDPPVDPTRQAMPPVGGVVPIEPRPATRLPRDREAWTFEADFGGVRALVWSEGGRCRVVVDGDDVTASFPELRDLGRALGAVACVLDGTIAGPGADRRAASSESAARRAAGKAPLVFVAADVLWLEGHATTDLPWERRRAFLERLAIEGPAWRTAPTHRGDGRALLDAVRAQGLPRVVAKKVDGRYEPGAWRFITADR